MMLRRRIAFLGLLAAALGVAMTFAGTSSAAAEENCTLTAETQENAVTTLTGTCKDGAKYLIQYPAPWNGTLLLYSHGYVAPGSPNNPAVDSPPGYKTAREWLLSHGYALAGSSYASTGWAVKEALQDQIYTLDEFEELVAPPNRTIAWGSSLGGIITAGLLQDFPGRFTAALPMCGVLGGGVGAWNEGLDSAFAIQQLLGAGTVPQVVEIAEPSANLAQAEQLLFAAQGTPQGRARIALAAALTDLPGWFAPTSPEPAATDFAAQEENQFKWEAEVTAPFGFAFRADLEARAGGNPSWNTGVNYEKQLENSVDFAEVEALYATAGLSLEADLATLNSAPRISADQSAIEYLTKNIVFNGDLSGRPVLTMHTTGDGLVVNENEQAYRSAVARAGDSSLLREVFVHRAGHCTFSSAEQLSALHALVQRLDTGKWAGSTEPEALNAFAYALGPKYSFYPPSFIEFEPTPFLRPFDLAGP